jgi:transcription elongation factor GreA
MVRAARRAHDARDAARDARRRLFTARRIMATVAHQLEPITREGYERLRAELEHLVTARRREVAEWLREAREDGAEPGENPDVGAALDEQAQLERRIDEIEAALAVARIAEPPEPGVAGIGRHVRLRLDGAAEPVAYELVGALEADPTTRRISVGSPVGRALVGRRAGDLVAVETPGGVRTVEILAVGDDA